MKLETVARKVDEVSELGTDLTEDESVFVPRVSFRQLSPGNPYAGDGLLLDGDRSRPESHYEEVSRSR